MFEQVRPDLRYILAQLNQSRKFDFFDDVRLFQLMMPHVAMQAAQLIRASSAQLRQDVFAAVTSAFRKGGYFAEIGATDGVYLSNTLMLEKEFGWSGVLAEPARYWHAALAENRRSAIDTRCVYSRSGEKLTFREIDLDPALSTLVKFTDGDFHQRTREEGKDYTVDTVSLVDLLRENEAPSYIDYISLDTEGSEFSILEPFDFDAFQFGLISCEHNYSDARARILQLLSDQGYVRVLNHLSLFDDWYVHPDRLETLEAAMPEWQAVSSQTPEDNTRPMTQSEQTISLLQENLGNVLEERGAYKKAVEDQLTQNAEARDARLKARDARIEARDARLKAQDELIQTLNVTVKQLELERDAYKKAARTFIRWRKPKFD